MGRKEVRHLEFEVASLTEEMSVSPQNNKKPPKTKMQALMESGLLQEPEISQEEMLEVREKIIQGFNSLNPEEVWVVNALAVEEMSLRAVAKQLNAPKTTIARVRDRAFLKLRTHMIDNPEIVEILIAKGYDL